MVRAAFSDIQVTIRQSSGNDERGRFNTVGDNPVFCAVELVNAFDADRRCPGSLDLCAHLVEQFGEIGHFRFASAILDDRLAFGQRSCHQQVFGSCDGDLVEDNLRSLEPVSGSLYVSMLGCNLRAEPFQSLNV